MMTRTLSRYFGARFLSSVMATFVGIIVLAGMIDYFELMRRGADWPKATAWILAEISIFRIPQLTEHIMPFAILVGAMSCYLTLSRRLELVIARSAGISAWQFVAPALLVAFLFGTFATVAYNPIAAMMHERSKRLEEQMLDEIAVSPAGEQQRFLGSSEKPRWSGHHQCARPAANKAPALAPSPSTPSTMRAHFQERIEARTAELRAWLLAARRHPHLFADQTASSRGHLSAQHQSDPRTSAGELCHARNRAILGPAQLYPDGGPSRPRRRRLPLAIR